VSHESAKILIVTGYSGAGMSSALKNLEDLGYEVLDNFPLSLVDSLIGDTPKGQNIAIGIDTRSRGFSLKNITTYVKKHGAKLLFLYADPITLQKRFAETRRKHPLAKDRPATAGIEKEQKLLEKLQAKADVLIDTSNLSVPELRQILKGHFSSTNNNLPNVTLMSFGFRYGAPREADIIMDVRFLKNPHWEEKLRPMSGLDKPVGQYIAQDPAYEGFINNFMELISPLIPKYADEGKTYLTIAIGCTGGQHRSVFITEKLRSLLKKLKITPHVNHRDIKR
jgi:UPF0042 nucleotide-binding protein